MASQIFTREFSRSTRGYIRPIIDFGSYILLQKLVRRETSLSPLARRRKVPHSATKPRAEKFGLPLQPIEFNIKPRISQKQAVPSERKGHPPQTPKKNSPPRRSFSSVDQVEEPGPLGEEDLDTRATKRRRVSMPGELISVVDPDAVVARSRSRLETFRWAHRLRN